MIFTKIFIYDKFKSLLISLNNNNFISELNYNQYDKIILGENNNNNINRIRIWKSNAINDYYKNDMCSNNLLGCLDYIIYKNYIKIEFLSIKDGFENLIYKKKNILNEIDSKDLNDSLIMYIEKIAKLNNIKKIIIDVHHNLKFYNKYYKSYGFELTEKVCDDNPYWIEIIKIVK